MKKTCSKSSILGFTLVELLIVISILAILFSIGLVQYTRFNRQQILGQAVLGLKNNLAYAREMALSGKKNCEGVFDGILVRFDGTENEYGLYSSCNNKTDLVLIATYKVEPVSLGSLPVGNEILFKSLNSGTNFSEEQTITLVASSGGTGNTAGVTVAPSGKLEIVFPSPASSCAGCWSGSVCEPGTTVEKCGMWSVWHITPICFNCNDGNECTIDECLEGVCRNLAVDDGTECGYGETLGQCLLGTCVPY